MLQVRLEVRDFAERFIVDADQNNLLLHRHSVRRLESHQCRRSNNAGDFFEVIAEQFPDLCDGVFRMMNLRQQWSRHFDVRKHAVETMFHLINEARHDAVNDNQRRDAKRNADDRSQRNESCAEVPPRQKKFVHSPIPGCVLCEAR